MKSHKSKNFILKSYIYNIKNHMNLPNIVTFASICILVFLFLAFCNKSPSSSETSTHAIQENYKISASDVTSEMISSETPSETETMGKSEKRSLEIALLYKDIYINAEKTISDYYLNTTVISQKDIDKIETLLSSNGYPVINSDSKYPAYLENSDGVYAFWKYVSENKDTEQELIRVSSSGGLYYSLLRYSSGQKYYTGIAVEWDENNMPFISEEEHMEVLDWDLADNGDFYYQIYLSRRPYDDYITCK